MKVWFVPGGTGSFGTRRQSGAATRAWDGLGERFMVPCSGFVVGAKGEHVHGSRFRVHGWKLIGRIEGRRTAAPHLDPLPQGERRRDRPVTTGSLGSVSRGRWRWGLRQS